VIVINQAEEKSLRQIRDELQQKSARAVNIEKSGPPTWHKWARLAPAFMRRGVVRAMSSSVPVRRSKIGTVQITSVGLADMEMYLPTHLGTTTLISVGGTKMRPVVVGNQVEARAHGLHRVFRRSACCQRGAFAQNLSSFQTPHENPKLIKE
jgi:hypothetical protein